MPWGKWLLFLLGLSEILQVFLKQFSYYTLTYVLSTYKLNEDPSLSVVQRYFKKYLVEIKVKMSAAEFHFNIVTGVRF